MPEFSILTAQDIIIAKHRVTGKCIFVRLGETYPQKDYTLVINVDADKVLELILNETGRTNR